MKQIAAIFILFVFVMSFIVAAQQLQGATVADRPIKKIQKISAIQSHELKKLERLDENKLQNIENLSDDEIKKVATLGRERIKELANLKQAEIKAMVAKIKMVNAVHKRNVAEAKVKEAEDRFKIAKQLLIEKRSAIQEKKQRFDEIKESYKACRNDTSANCTTIKEITLNRSREIIINHADMLISNLNKIKEKVSSNANINDTDASKIIADIDAAIAELEAAKAMNMTTKDEIKVAAANVKNIWKKAEHRAIMHAYRVVRAEVGEIIIRAEKLEKKLDKILDYAESKNISVADIQAKVDEFSAKIESAKAKFNESQKAFQEAIALRKNAINDSNVTDNESASIINKVKEARSLAQAAHKDLKDANVLLKEIGKMIRNKIKDVKLTDKELTDSETPLPAAIGTAETEVEEIEVPIEVV